MTDSINSKPRSMLTRLRQKIALWIDPTPERLLREEVELIVKCARRCAHDLQHAASEVSYTPYDKIERSRFFRERADYWLTIFYPGADGKNYRARLYLEINRLERLCEKNGISTEQDIFGDI